MKISALKNLMFGFMRHLKERDFNIQLRQTVLTFLMPTHRLARYTPACSIKWYKTSNASIHLPHEDDLIFQ